MRSRLSRRRFVVEMLDQSFLDNLSDPPTVKIFRTNSGRSCDEDSFNISCSVLFTPDVAVGQVVKQGELIPVDEESFNHSARVCDVGPDGMLYISLGQPHNVTPPDKIQKYLDTGISGIIRMKQDGTGREAIARGVRNSVGQDFDPKTGNLWFTDNQVDGMGDDIPPGEINHMTAIGLHFGHQWYGGGDTRTNEYKDEEVPVEVTMPVSQTIAHAADLGLMFYYGSQFPEKYQSAIFSAQHGSWNRTTAVGASLMVSFIAEDGTVKTRLLPKKNA